MLCKWLQQNAVRALGPGCNWSTIEYYGEIWICCIPCHTCDQQGFYDDNDDGGDDLTGSSAKVGIILPYDGDDIYIMVKCMSVCTVLLIFFQNFFF